MLVSPASTLVGARLGPYEIVALLGAGGIGQVYRASDSRLGREVALKILPVHLAADAGLLRRFMLEARVTGSLNHPNVIAVYDVGEHQGAPYLVCELLEGETLRSWLQSGPLPLPLAIECSLGVARGLAAAHAKAVVHRDLKPETFF